MQSYSQRVQLLEVPNDSPTHKLQDKQDQDGYADAVVRICQCALGTDSQISEDEDDNEQETREYLKVGVVFNGVAWAATVEAHGEDSPRDEEKENEGSENTVGEDHLMILVQRCESIAHTYNGVSQASTCASVA